MSNTNSEENKWYIIDPKTNKVGDVFYNIADWGDGTYEPKGWKVVGLKERVIVAEPTHMSNTLHRFMEGQKFYKSCDDCRTACKQLMNK